MKKIFSVITTIIFIFAMITSVSAQEISHGVLPCDVNDDGRITAADARHTLRVSANLEKLDDASFIAADVNCDGKVTASDARKILRISAGLEKADKEITPLFSVENNIADVVVNFGAYGDGVHDDTKAIQNALDYMKKSGGTIYFPDGEYIISACLIFYSEQELVFGDNAVLRRAANDAPAKYMLASYTDSSADKYNGVQNSKIIGGKFDGNSEVSSKLTIINLCHANNVTISDAEYVNGSFWHYIEMASCKNIIIENCLFDAESYTLFRKDLTDELIQLDVAKSGNYGPIYNIDGAFVNFIKDEVPCSDIYIKNCVFNCACAPAIGEHNGYAHSDIFIFDNVFNGISGTASVSNGYIKFMSATTGVEVYNNTFNSTAGDTIKNKGVVCLNNDKDTNKAYNNVFTGYFTQYFSDNIVAKNNRFN